MLAVQHIHVHVIMTILMHFYKPLIKEVKCYGYSYMYVNLHCIADIIHLHGSPLCILYNRWVKVPFMAELLLCFF